MKWDFLAGSVVTGQGETVLNCQRVDLDWTPGRNFLLQGWWDIGTVCPETTQISHYGMCSKSGWTGLWATWSSERCPCPGHGGWTKCIFQTKTFVDSVSMILDIQKEIQALKEWGSRGIFITWIVCAIMAADLAFGCKLPSNHQSLSIYSFLHVFDCSVKKNLWFSQLYRKPQDCFSQALEKQDPSM